MKLAKLFLFGASVQALGVFLLIIISILEIPFGPYISTISLFTCVAILLFNSIKNYKVSEVLLAISIWSFSYVVFLHIMGFLWFPGLVKDIEPFSESHVLRTILTFSIILLVYLCEFCILKIFVKKRNVYSFEENSSLNVLKTEEGNKMNSAIRDNWWNNKRKIYNASLIIAGFMAALSSIFFNQNFEPTFFTLGVNGMLYLLFIGMANVCYKLGSVVEKILKPANVDFYRNVTFGLGLAFSLCLPVLIIVISFLK